MCKSSLNASCSPEAREEAVKVLLLFLNCFLYPWFPNILAHNPLKLITILTTVMDMSCEQLKLSVFFPSELFVWNYFHRKCFERLKKKKKKVRQYKQLYIRTDLGFSMADADI